MPKGVSQARAQQPFTSGLGRAFTSPVKRSRTKAKTLVQPIGAIEKRRKLEARLLELQNPTSAQPDVFHSEVPSDVNMESSAYVDQADAEQLQAPSDADEPGPSQPPDTDVPRAHRILPNEAANDLYDRWASVLPRLTDALLAYVNQSHGKVPARVTCLESKCGGMCEKKTSRICCLFQDYFQQLDVIACGCQDSLQILVSHGLFPTAPSYPRMAISIHLLDFYQALFEKSCDAVNAMASALNTFYTRRGFVLLNKKGIPVQDAFRRGLGHAIQWYNNLQIRVEQQVEAALVDADNRIQQAKAARITSQTPTTPIAAPPSTSPHPPPPMIPPVIAPAPPLLQLEPLDHSVSQHFAPTHSPERLPSVRSPPATSQPSTPLRAPLGKPAPLTPGQCARILQQRCPACFGGTHFGRLGEDGADIHVSVDGNFNHRHLRKAGECPKFYEPEYTLPKEQIDAVGKRMEQLRKAPPKPYKPVVPTEAVDECESSHTAGSGANTKTNMDRFDDTGLMALVCRHDIPIFLANIDTPGEQQKYAVAMIIHLFSLLPAEATVAFLYDVGCVLDRSLHLYDFLPADFLRRATFSTNAMHAYLIGITRSSARSRRIWLIDRQAKAIAAELRDDLGDWIRRRLTKGVDKQGKDAEVVLRECGIPLEVLSEQWKLQKASQLSARAHSPKQLKKELDMVLNLQGDLDIVENAIQSARTALWKSESSKDSLHLLTGLEDTHEELKEKVEALYASLNVQQSFPELQGIDLEFIRTLLMARDLKINIRKRAIGSFFEWDKLDQAAGGRDQAMGTKLHQATRQAIQKRKPALMNAIKKFNKYCATLASLYKPEWAIPLPDPLPTDLKSLREGPLLMEDIWITRSPGEVPRWLEDLDVREGIRGMLKAERCHEERRRLGVEADNLCRWFGRELASIELAIATPANAGLIVPLTQQRTRLLGLQARWVNPLASNIRFETHRQTASAIARTLSDTHNTRPLVLIPSCSSSSNMTIFEPLPSTGATSNQEVCSDEGDEEGGRDEEAENERWKRAVDVSLIWDLPADLQQQPDLLTTLQFQTFGSFAPLTASRVLHRPTGRIVFDERELAIMQSPVGRLNDVCINGISTLLHDQFSAPTHYNFQSSQRCALFSTYDLQMVRYNAADAELWRRTKLTEYWTRDVWILPIHRSQSEHWVMCTISLNTRELFLFDSFGSRAPWRREIQEIMQLITRLVLVANRHGHSLHVVTEEGWTARPVVTDARQTNGVDCGLWVLANVGAVLSGFHVTGLVENNMPHLRALLLRHLLALPT
ncbi:hypothetical protein LshimejAT787_3800020 [Lyophyllum shimeji]|uniref:Ubiquitin-like protease family profile domain-containing protein n=1 Tax=Lyophyllum shimeji TaxID=47721 RepID=A0A9P3Q1H8_LYOSH|nr:hypothetical protein LshimejAT787_3800020 [Lyophyllum shimeji]